MMNIFRKFCSKKSSNIPSPPIPRSFKGLIFGHLETIKEKARINKTNLGSSFVSLQEQWYKQAKSKTIKIRLIFEENIVTSDPLLFKEILGTKQDAFTNSSKFKQIAGYTFKNSLIAIDGEQWHRIRKIIQRAISKQDLNSIVPIMCDSMQRMFLQTQINTYPTIKVVERITFDTFHKVMYGWDPLSVEFNEKSSEILNCCEIILDSVGVRLFTNPISWRIPTKENLKVERAIKFLKLFIIDFINNQRQILGKKLEEEKEKLQTNLLDAMLIAAESGEDGGLTDIELIDQIASLFFVGFDTTSNTILILLNYLSRYPEVQEKLRKEIRTKFPNGISDLSKATVSDLESINYLRYFIDEVYRLNAIFPFLKRGCIKDTVVGGYEIKKGTKFFIDTRSVGKEPDYWGGMKDLDDFRPERWGEYTPLILESALPFGFGGRICPGRKIASNEIKIFIAYILCEYKICLRNPNENFEFNVFLSFNLKKDNGHINFIKL